MSRQYLDVPYRAKDAAKALGARFDGAAKRWFVETGVDLMAFAAWLPAGVAAPDSSTGMAFLPATDSELSGAKRGISLSRLLSGVSTAVARAFDEGVWTLVEVNDASMRNGHVYLDLSERDGQGQLIAKARGTLWASTAARILPDFERATGAVVGAGIKLLVRARPVFKSQFGFSLDIDAIDAAFTLGDLEARKTEIRARLRQEGVLDRNRSLAAPWDYRLVLVIAPQDAAGLGDFRKEAERLERFGLCRFVYAHSRFQGEGAAGQIVATATAALAANARPDALVFIRGGGAVNDLAWLNDYALARFICDQDIPVLTGIGHERDSTLPDEVAQLRFDTPSKVIAGIEQQIRRRAQQALTAWETVLGASEQATRDARLAVERAEAQVRADARDQLARARRDSQAARSAIAVRAVQQGHTASRRSLALVSGIRSDAEREVGDVRRHTPALLASIRSGALLGLSEGRARSQVACNAIVERAAVLGQSASHNIVRGMHQVVERAHGEIRRQRDGAQALVREITGQVPRKRWPEALRSSGPRPAAPWFPAPRPARRQRSPSSSKTVTRTCVRTPDPRGIDMPEPSPPAQAPAQTFREAYGVLQQHAETLRDQDEPNIDDLLTIVTESVAAYKVCRQRIDAVEAALKAALDDADMGTSFSPEGVKAPLAGPAAREVPQRPAPDPDDVPF